MPPTNLSRNVSPRFSRSLRVAVTESTALLRRSRLAPCQTVTAAGPGGGATPNHFSCIFAIVAARAQQPAMPVIGYLYSLPPLFISIAWRLSAQKDKSGMSLPKGALADIDGPGGNKA
jgi:hypothetical protein